MRIFGFSHINWFSLLPVAIKNLILKYTENVTSVVLQKILNVTGFYSKF